MQVELKKASQLTAEEIATWKAFQASNPTLESPYFHPQFAQAVAAVRNDVEVAVIYQQEAIQAFFPFQRGALGLGKPVGGKLSDYHGLIAPTGTFIDMQELLRQCRLAGWDFDHLPTEQQSFAKNVHEVTRSPQIETVGGMPEYERKRKAAGSDVIAKVKQKIRRFERDHGPLELTLDDKDPAVFEQLIAWKSAQYLRTGLADVFAFPWTRALLENLQNRTTPEFGCFTTTLRAQGKVLSSLLCLRQGGLVHGWFTAYDPDMSQFSPGLMHYLKWIEVAEQDGVHKIDLGKGDEAYKWRFATTYAEIAEGCVCRNSVGIWLRNSWRTTRSFLESVPGRKEGSNAITLLNPIRRWLQFR